MREIAPYDHTVRTMTCDESERLEVFTREEEGRTVSQAGPWSPSRRSSGQSFHITFAVRGTAEAWRDADAVVHLRIDGSGPGASEQPGLNVEHTASLIAVLKAHPTAGPTGASVTFTQSGSSSEKPYPPGDEFIAFLHWSKSSGRFYRLFGPESMYQIKHGLVSWLTLGRTGATSETMTIGEFVEKLRSLGK